jgi:cytochrome c peroxidase
MRKYGVLVVGAAVTAACALAVALLLHPQHALGEPPITGEPATVDDGSTPPISPDALFGIGPIPCQPVPPDIVVFTPLEQLGKKIIFDCTLSNPPGYACVQCHQGATGFTTPLTNGSDINLLIGCPPGVVPGRFDNRRAMSYAYAAFSPEGPYFDATFADAYVGGDFWDGRVPDLTGQSMQPFMNPNEMNNTPTNGIYPPVLGGYAALVAEKATTAYKDLFELAYGPGILDRTTRQEQFFLVCSAEAAFEGSGEVCQFSSKYDASKYGVPPQNLYTLSASEENGRMLYFGKAICNTCHSSALFPPVLAQTNGKDTFSMYCFANIGSPRNYNNPFYLMTDCVSNPHGCNPQGGKWVDFGLGANPNPGIDGTKFYNTTPGDIPQFRGLFQSTTVRNVDLRPSPGFVKAYMHNGVFKSLAEVVHFYNKRNIAVFPTTGMEVAFDLAMGPPMGYKRLFPPPEVLDNVQNSAGTLGGLGNLGLSAQEEADLVAFMQILSDGFTGPNPVH